jgi:Predicted AAA-ATPase/PD-(D/E)XK nuclease superfamily
VDILRNFFSVLKSRDADIRFSFLTGVSKIGKLGVFSGLNNLEDISSDRQFATLCGYTQEELEANFPAELEGCMGEFGMGREELLGLIKNWYNGYSWDGEASVYNPFSILNFLKKSKFMNFWFETGTPTFLVKRIREGFVLPQDLDNLQADFSTLEAVGTGETGALALLFQTGYLTIKSVEGPPTSRILTLGFPNAEVRESFLRRLLSEYTGMPVDMTGVEVAVKMRKALQANDLDTFFKIARSVFASVPYPVFRTHEDYFHALMHVMLVLTGMKVQAEEMTNVGRMDNVLDTGTRIYIFEYKIDKPAEEALAQIMEKGYQEKLLIHNKPVTLVGVCFGTGERNITEWKIYEG